MIDFIGFFIAASIIFFAGKQLAAYGDRLAELTGMGKAWFGLVLMATVTSLPELMVGISSSAIMQSADLATGDILGSCAFNLGLLSLLDIFTPNNSPLFMRLSRSHILAVALGILLISLVGFGLFFDQDIVLLPFIGFTSISFGLVYILGVRTLYRYRVQHPISPEETYKSIDNLSRKQIIYRYAGYAAVIVATALTLPYFAGRIAEITGLGESFTGTLFLALSTSLPELAVAFSAMRIGAANMAAGNLIGSNLFNVFILFIDDLFYTRGHLLKDASDVHLVSVFFVLMMSATAIIGFIFPSTTKKLLFSWDTLIILFLFLMNLILLYRLS